MRLATFDIFDTSLLRKCGHPHNIFHIVAHRLFPDDYTLRNGFVRWRISSDTPGHTISEVYRPDRTLFFAEFHTAEEMMQMEMTVESENLAPHPETTSIIRSMRNNGWTIKFLSDMYLPGSFLKGILLREGLANDDEEVIVSCEWGARKAEGDLYEKVREKYRPEAWTHFGDNIHSDIKMAKKHKVKTIIVRSPFSIMEKTVARSDGGRELAYLAGLSRYARITLGDTSYARLAADYVVPVILPYVLYVLFDAKRRGLKHLHFVTRDGYIMYEIARHLDTEDIDIHLTHISRKALSGAFRYVCNTNEYELMYQGHAPDSTGDKSEFIVAAEYLSDNGIFDNDTAIADIGWKGHTRMMLHAIARAIGRPMPVTYYFCTNPNVLGPEYGEYISYHQKGEKGIMDHVQVLESYFCAAPFPTTDHYIKGDDGSTHHILGCKSDIDNTPIVEANTNAAIFISKALAESGTIRYLQQSIDKWGKTTLKTFVDYSHPIDYKPFGHAEGIVSPTLAQDMTWHDFPWMGFYSDFKFASYANLLGYKTAKIIWRLRKAAIHIIGFFSPKT